MLDLRIVPFLFLLSGCIVSGARPQPQPAPHLPRDEPSSDPILGSVDGMSFRQSSLDTKVQAQIRKLKNESAQRQMHLLWVGLENEFNTHLFEQEAERRGMAVDELKRVEITEKIEEPSNDAIQQAYDANKGRLSVPFEQAAPIIRQRLLEHAIEQEVQRFAKELRQGKAIEYQIPVPELPRQSIDVGDAPSQGSPTARVTIIEFSDFQCPYCSEARRVLHILQKEYPKDVRIVFRDFPLAQHPRARAAAEAAQCAHEQGKFWSYHDTLFENSQRLESEDLRRYGEKIGLHMEKFTACIESSRPKRAVDRHMEAAKKYGVDGTPAIFVNGIKLIGVLPMPLIRALIDQEIQRSPASATGAN